MSVDVSRPIPSAPDALVSNEVRAGIEEWTVRTGPGVLYGAPPARTVSDGAIDIALASVFGPARVANDNAFAQPPVFSDANPREALVVAPVSLLERRRSVRHFTDVMVDESAVRAVIQHAAWAPSGGNDQRWKVTAVSPDRAHAFLTANESRAWAALTPKLHSVTERRLGPGAPLGQSEEMVRAMVESDGRFRGRPWMIVVHYAPEFLPVSLWKRFFRAVTHPLFGGSRLRALVDVWTMHARVSPVVDEHSVAMFLYALTLAATEHDLGSCIQYSPRAFSRPLRQLARIPAGHSIVGTLLLGETDTASDAVKNAPARAKRQPVAIDVVA